MAATPGSPPVECLGTAIIKSHNNMRVPAPRLEGASAAITIMSVPAAFVRAP